MRATEHIVLSCLVRPPCPKAAEDKENEMATLFACLPPLLPFSFMPFSMSIFSSFLFLIYYYPMNITKNRKEAMVREMLEFYGT